MPETDGSVQVATPAAGTPAVTAGGEGEGSNQVAASDPFAGLEADTRSWVEKAGLKDVKSVVEKARNAESLIGKSVQVPGPDAKPEDWNKFYGRIGRPEKPEGYEFKLPEGLPKEFPYDGDFAKEFRSWAHAEGLTPKQAAKLHDSWVQKTAGSYTSQQEANAKQLSDATDGLVKEWGPPEGDKFKQGSEMAVRGLKGLGLEESFEKLGLLGPNRIVKDAKVALALEQVGRKLFSEDTAVAGSAGVAGANPFAGSNATEQNLLWKSDRPKAEALIRAAGKTPADFGYRV